jgi:hypothetical protein
MVNPNKRRLQMCPGVQVDSEACLKEFQTLMPPNADAGKASRAHLTADELYEMPAELIAKARQPVVAPAAAVL